MNQQERPTGEKPTPWWVILLLALALTGWGWGRHYSFPHKEVKTHVRGD